jgi:surface polysaccharide O-acyltransferase-like enzyme
VAFIGLGKQRLNNDSPLWSKFSRSTFAVYIFHPLVVISIALAVSSVNIEPALKLIFVAPIVVILSFLLGGLIVSIPGVNKIA